MRCQPCLIATFLILSLLVLFRTAHPGNGEKVNSALSAGLSNWMKLHPPRTHSHDAELLRRRMLASIMELGVDELVLHAPQLVASLRHGDRQVRHLALGMLGRLRPQVLADWAETLAASLGSKDDAVRRYILELLIQLGDVSTITACGPLIFECLSSGEQEVRSAAVSALALLEPEDLSTYTQAAAERLVQQRDTSLAVAAVSSWGAKLESDACTARAGEAGCQGVLQALRKLAP